MAWEGSCRQSPGPRNTKRIRGGRTVGEEAKRSEAQCHPDRAGVDAPGRWESHAPYPGRSAHLPWRLTALRGVAMDEQKSAEAVVAAAHSGEGPNTRSRVGTKRSMSEPGVEKKAEKLERTWKVGGGTAEDTGPARQALTARGEHAKPRLGSSPKRRCAALPLRCACEVRVLFVNRRVRNRSHGGVVAGGGQLPPATRFNRRC